MENKSGWEPTGHAVLLKPYDPEVKKGAIIIPAHVEKGMQRVDQRGIVVAIGPDCWAGETPRASVGDKVLVTRFCGALIDGADGEPYRVVNDNDLFLRSAA